MGYRWEVFVFDPNDYKYRLVYGGSSAFKAVKAAVKHKLKGVGYVKVDWR